MCTFPMHFYPRMVATVMERLKPIFATKGQSLFGNRNSQQDRINITIRRWDSKGGKVVGEDTPFTVKPTSSFRGIFRIYAVRETEHPDCLGFFQFMAGDKVLNLEDCPADARVADGDCIDAIPCTDDLAGSRFV